MADYQLNVTQTGIGLDLSVQQNILNVETVDYQLSLSRTGGQGAHGYSTYDLAVKNGYIGTEQEWLDEQAATSAALNALVASAATSEANAATSEANAATSETNAATSASNAATSEANASLSETNAATSEINAATSETNANASAVASEASANAALTSETNAAASAATASQKAIDANSSAIDSAASAATATTKASEALTSATNALASATAAATSEANAATSEANAASSETATSSYANSAATSASNAATSETNAATSASNASSSESNAATSATNAATSETNALSSENAAATSATNSANSAVSSQNSASNSLDSATASANSATNSATSATSANNSAISAAASLASVELIFDNFDDRYLGAKASDPSLDNDGNALLIGAVYWNTTTSGLRFYNGTEWEEPETTATNAATSASNSASSALTSATNAAISETNADTYATNASNSASAASTSETNAGISEANASNSATASAASALIASTKEAEATTSASNAATSESNAASSASAASTSATNAASSALSASSSETTAVASATAASNSETASALSASNAATSETNAATSETNAAASALSASNSETAASLSETAASNSETNAATSETNAATSEVNAATSETNAATSETNAANSATASATSATNSANSATASANSATNSANSATASETSASNAATSETNAFNSAEASAASATSAATSAANAAAAYDSFDDRYLGSKPSAPTVDNDGNPLLVGALYYNNGTIVSEDKGMWIYDGVIWIAASAASQAILTTYNYTATSGQTVFSGNDDNSNPLAYTAGSIIVTLNGIFLEGGTDYTATDGASIVLSPAAIINDELNILVFSTFDSANVYALGDTRYARNADNTDITSLTGVTSGISSPDFIQFDTTITPVQGVGKLQWDPDNGTLQVGLVGGNVNLQIGEEQVARVFNADTVPLTDGMVVYLFGAQGGRPSVKRANNVGDLTSSKTLGVVTETIAVGGDGYVTTKGIVNGLNTSAYNEGDILYLGSNGGLTKIPPVSPLHSVFIGVVLRANSGNGGIYVSPQNGYEIEELHNVLINLVSNNQVLRYNSTTSLWENSSLGTAADTASTDYATAAQGTTADTAVQPNTSPTFTGVNLGDNAKAIFGNGSDLQIYHDGSHSYISDQGTGQLRILASQFQVMNPAGTESMVFGAQDNTATLYYDNSAKLATTATGIDVTGTVVSDGLTVAGDGSFVVSNTGATETLLTVHNSGVANGTTAEIKMAGGNGLSTRYAYIRAVNGGASAGNPHDLVFGTNDNSASPVDRLKIADNGDISFYEDTGTTAKFFWDASAEFLGIGTTAPTVNGESLRLVNGLFINTLGTNSVPSVALGDANSGLFAPIAGEVAIATNGGTRLTVSGTGIDVTGTVVADGLALNGTQPNDVSIQLTTSGDGWTIGTDYNANNDIDLVLKGGNAGGTFTERVRITSAGNVGIGTSAPESFWGQANKLVVGGSGNQGISIYGTSTSRLAFVDTTTGNPGLDSGGLITYNHTDNKFLFSVAGNNRLSIRSDGHVGMGTDTPDYKLEVVDGSSRFYYDFTTFGIITNVAGGYGRYLKIWNSDASGDGEAVGLGNLSGSLIFGTGFQGDTQSPANGEAMRIRSDGNITIVNNVGIGALADAPATLLELAKNNNGLAGSPPINILRFTDNDTGLGVNQPTGRIEFYVKDVSPGGTGVGSYIEGRADGSDGGGYLVFADSAGGATGATERMRLIDGNLGIGTPLPAYKLTINDPGTGLGFTNAASGNFNIGLLAGTGSPWAYIFQRANSDLLFGTNNTERMRITSAGNLGLGVTPSVWYPTFRAFQFGGNGSSLFGRSENNMASIGSNVYVNAAGGNTYINTNTASYFQQINGAFQWYTAPSGTAGSAISFTQAMTLTSAGDLLVGYTSSVGYKMTLGGGGLHINGSNHGSMSSGQQGFTIDYASGLTTLRGRSNSSITRGQIAFNVIENDNGNDLEAMRITSAGDLLVKATSSFDISTQTINGFAATSTGRTNISRDAGVVLGLQRTTSDGDIVEFRKGTTTVGSIGNFGDNLGIESVDVGLLFLSGSAQIVPTGGNYGVSDGTKDLGRSTTRFKDLYLSGGVYVGGTAAANHLDEYEEGSWTPVVADATSGGNEGTATVNYAKYTKIGNVVTISARLLNINTTGLTGGNTFYLRGMPFVSRSDNQTVGTVATSNIAYTGSNTTISCTVAPLDSWMRFWTYGSGSGPNNVAVNDITSGTADIYFTVTYFTA